MKLFNKLYQWIIAPEHLFAYYLAAIMVPNAALCFTENMPLLACACNIILPASAFAWLFTLKRRPGIMIWVLFPLVFLAAFELVLLYMFKSSIIAVDMFLNVVTTNFTEAFELLNNIVPAVAGVFILYLPALILGIFSIIRKERLGKVFTSRVRKISGVGIVIGILMTVVSQISDEDYDFKLHLFPANACYNFCLAVERSHDFSSYPETSADFKYGARATHDTSKPEVYMLVIGETGRACNWGLYGYGRNTTPLLEKDNNVVAFTDVLTQSNTTHISVPMIMSLASAEHHDRIYREKGIITAFREAGFYTAFFSNQRFNHSFIDIFGNEAHRVVFLKENERGDVDINDNMLIGLVDNLMAEGHKKLFIVLHTYGSHFKYTERYTDESRVFTPDEIVNVSAANRQNLINAYDNTIVQTDRFLHRIITRLNGKGIISALLYSSDHGEDIFDDERGRFLHSSPIPTYYQLHIPFIVWTSDCYASAYPSVVDNIWDNRNKPVGSNASTIHTLLDIAGIETPYLADSLSLASENYHVSRRHFINDHNLPVPYDKVGLRPMDILQFKKHGISIK